MKNSENLARIALNKSLLKEYHNNQDERIVYLNDGDEFQIQLFNPFNYVIGISFSFNSDDNESSKLLVIKPGERIWLDRYLDEDRKLKFSTYEVGNSKAVKEAIKNNGELNVYFYSEVKNKPYYVYNGSVTSISSGDLKPWKDDIWYTTSTYDNSVEHQTCYTNFCQSTINANYNNNNTYSCSCASASYPSNKIETGRIEKGNKSSQKFDKYYGDFDYLPFKKETIKILPQSQKQISSDELKRKYCWKCGRKIKDKFEYCPYCGTKQN